MTYFKCIATLENGAHKIVRVTRDVMATLVFGFRSLQGGVQVRHYKETAERLGLDWLRVHKMLFINEYTHDRLEIA